MSGDMTVRDVLSHVHAVNEHKRCPTCGARVSIRGLAGEYWWTCLECDAVGFGFSTRAEAREHLFDSHQ